MLVLRAAMDDQMQRANRRSRLESIGQVASGLAHEVGSLLQPIVSMAQMTQEDHQADRELVKTMQVILESARRASDIVQGMMLYVRRPKNELPRLSLAKAVMAELDILRPCHPVRCLCRLLRRRSRSGSCDRTRPVAANHQELSGQRGVCLPGPRQDRYHRG